MALTLLFLLVSCHSDESFTIEDFARIAKISTVTSPSAINIGNQNSYALNGTCYFNTKQVSLTLANLNFNLACTNNTWNLGATDVSALGDSTSIALQVSQEGGVSSSYTIVKDTALPSAVTGINWASAWTNTTSSPSASWTNPGADVSSIQVALGSSSGATDIVNWTDIGNTTSHTFTSLSLTECSVDYFISVKVIDAGGNESSVLTSATGFKSDLTDPIAVGSLADDDDNSSSFTGNATWTAGSDACSFSHYEIAVGTTSGGQETIPWTNIGSVLNYKAYDNVNGLDFTLIDMTDYFTSIRAVDSAGNVTVETTSAWRLPIEALRQGYDVTISSGSEVAQGWSLTGYTGSASTDATASGCFVETDPDDSNSTLHCIDKNGGQRPRSEFTLNNQNFSDLFTYGGTIHANLKVPSTASDGTKWVFIHGCSQANNPGYPGNANGSRTYFRINKLGASLRLQDGLSGSILSTMAFDQYHAITVEITPGNTNPVVYLNGANVGNMTRGNGNTGSINNLYHSSGSTGGTAGEIFIREYMMVIRQE